jgi:peptide/nickel transport system substrate-binding protein
VTDIERGLQRTIAAQFSALGSEIEGGSACGERGCDLPGVTVDSAARTVTITLVRPDGNFIDDLTASVAVPSTTPLGDQKNVLVPTTGPYRIARYVPHRLIAFTRNAYYRPWAPAAQPPGYPDRIEWRIDPADDRARQVREVGAQRADWADARRAASLETLAARFGGRLWLSPTQNLHGLALNTRIPPFSDVRVRRAVAYALNRRAVADVWITPGAITCQIIPPDLPAHRPYCPYTLQPDAYGDWTAPDFPTAQALVARSRYHGTPVTVWAEPAAKRGFAQVVSVLRQLGFPARLRLISSGAGDYFPFVADSRNKVQAFFYGFIAGDASPASLLEAFSCSAFRPADGSNNPNPAEFCDPSIDRLMSKARSIERSAPATANALWAQVDKRIVDAAPWVPLVTPSWIDVLSSRTHNYIRSVVLGVLFDQLWVR